MSTLITLVGQQPAAVAVTAKTLLVRNNSSPLDRVILLATEQTRTEAGRLEFYLKNLTSNLAVEPLFIALDPATADQTSLAWNIIRDKIKDGGLSEPIYYDTSPGLNYQVALISYHLRDEERIQPLYADFHYLHNLETGQTWELVDLGLKTLLDLHGLTTQPPVNDSDTTAANLEIKLDPRPSLALLQAVERKGRLHGLVCIWFTGDRDSILKAARQIAAAVNAPPSFQHLRPILTVWTNDYAIANRFQAYGFKIILEKNNDTVAVVEQWQEATHIPPGRRQPGPIDTPLNFSSGPIEEKGRGGWQGPNLIVALGDDPSTTLLAAFTHQPRHLLVLVDAKTEWVRAMANRICQRCQDFGSETITFWPTDVLGKIDHFDNFKAKTANVWHANISPGSKAQAWHLSRLPATLWSLDNSQQIASCLIANNRPLPYNLPPIVTQAYCVGGKLANEGLSLEQIKIKQDFLTACGNVVAQAVSLDVSITDTWYEGKKIFVNSNSFIECNKISPDGDSSKLVFTVTWNSKIYNGCVRSKPNEGHWLEEVVAGTLLKYFSQYITDMRVGLRWQWLSKKTAKEKFRTDMDIIIQWQGTYVGIECKSGIRRNSNALEEICGAVMAETREGLGRFAVPVLIRGNFPTDPTRALQDSEKTIAWEPLEIGLNCLHQGLSSKIMLLINKAIDHKRTTSR